MTVLMQRSVLGRRYVFGIGIGRVVLNNRCDVFKKFYIDDQHETLIDSSLGLVSHGWPTSSHKHLIDVMLIGPIGYEQHTSMHFFLASLSKQ